MHMPDVRWASIKSTKIAAINRTINLINCHVSCFLSKENTTERSYCCKEDRMNIFKKGTIFHEEFRGLSCQTPRENNRWKSEENPLIVVGGWPHLFFNGKWDCSNRKNHTRIIVISPHVMLYITYVKWIIWGSQPRLVLHLSADMRSLFLCTAQVSWSTQPRRSLPPFASL